MLKKLRLALIVAPIAILAGFTGPNDEPFNRNLGNMDYGVCRGINPDCYHNWPRNHEDTYRVLLYTKTSGPRHAALGKALPTGLNPALDESNAVQREMQRIARENGFELDYTEDDTIFRNLRSYNAVIFYSTSRDNLSDDAKTYLRQYMRAGGGFVAVHNAFGTLYNWPYYEGLLGGANFYSHEPVRLGDVKMLLPHESSSQAIPRSWTFQDEWYDLVPFPTNVRFIAKVDETTYREKLLPEINQQNFRTPEQRPRDIQGRHPGHGSFHPVAWCQYYDGGKVWATTLGHDSRALSANYSDFPGSEEFQKLLVGGIKSVMGVTPFCTN